MSNSTFDQTEEDGKSGQYDESRDDDDDDHMAAPVSTESNDFSSVSEVSKQEELVPNPSRDSHPVIGCCGAETNRYQDSCATVNGGTIAGSYLVERLNRKCEEEKAYHVGYDDHDSIVGKSVAIRANGKNLVDDDTVFNQDDDAGEVIEYDETAAAWATATVCGALFCDAKLPLEIKESPYDSDGEDVEIKDKTKAKNGKNGTRRLSKKKTHLKALQTDTEHTSVLHNFLGSLVGVKKVCEHCQKQLSYHEARVKMYHPEDPEKTKIYFHPQCKKDRAEMYKKKKAIQREFMAYLEAKNALKNASPRVWGGGILPNKRDGGLLARLVRFFKGCRNNKAVQVR